MKDTKIVITGKPLVDFDYIRNVLGDVVEGAIARNISLVAVGLVFNADGVKDILLELFNKIIGA